MDLSKKQKSGAHEEGLIACAERALHTVDNATKQFGNMEKAQSLHKCASGMWQTGEKKDYSKHKEALDKAGNQLIGLHRELTHGNNYEEIHASLPGLGTSAAEISG